MKNTISIKGVNYPLTPNIVRDMKFSGVTRDVLRERVKKGWTYHQAVNIPKGGNIKDYNKAIANKKNMLDKKAEYYENKRRQNKPYLYDETPQPPFENSEYAKHLCENHLIARLKTDSYGNTQLIQEVDYDSQMCQ